MGSFLFVPVGNMTDKKREQRPELGLVRHAHDPSIWKVDTGGLRVQDLPWIHPYQVWGCLENNNNNKNREEGRKRLWGNVNYRREERTIRRPSSIIGYSKAPAFYSLQMEVAQTKCPVYFFTTGGVGFSCITNDVRTQFKAITVPLCHTSSE